MRQIGTIVKRQQSLVRLKAVLMVVAMSLQLEQDIVGETMGCVPRMADCDFFVLAVS